MIKNKLIKIVMLISILLLIFSNCTVYAAGFVDPTENPGEWKPIITEEPALNEKAGAVLGIINIIGIISSVLVLVIIGIKYMLGSIEEKAEYKKSFVPLLVGAILVFGAGAIAKIIISLSGTFAQ